MMKKHMIVSIALMVFGMGIPLNLHAFISSEERAALIALYDSSNGDNWKRDTNWLGEADTECDWYGVNCDAEKKHVTSLSLKDNNLDGTIPAAVGELTFLRYLSLSHNYLRGTIPPDLGNLTNLEELFLNNNLLEGPVPPELANLTHLKNNTSDFRYNSLYTSDEALRDFLRSKQICSDWESSQDLPADITPPANPVIVINGGEEFTLSGEIQIALFAEDETGVTGYHVSESPEMPLPEAFVAVCPAVTDFSAHLSFTLSSGEGEKTLCAWFRDDAGNISDQASDTIIFSQNNEPPVIRLDSIVPRGDGSGLIDIEFTGTDPEGDSVTWYAPSEYCTYRAVSDDAADIPLVFVTEDSAHTALEPMIFSSRGTSYHVVADAASWTAGDYQIRLKAEDSYGNHSNYDYADPFSVDYDDLGQADIILVSPCRATADFRLLSFVHWPDDPSAQSVFGLGKDGLPNYDTKDFRIGLYDPQIGGYLEYGHGLAIEPGKAYWVFARGGLEIKDSGNPVSKSGDFDVQVNYHPDREDGWNMIAPPNDATYHWDNVEVFQSDADGEIRKGPMPMSSDANDLTDPRLWRWKHRNESPYYAFYAPEGSRNPEGALYENDSRYENSPLLSPHEGFWVRAKKENVFLRFPASAQQPTSHSSLLTPHSISLSSQSKSASDATDSPPAPIGGIAEGGVDDGGSGCFIGSLSSDVPMFTGIDFQKNNLTASSVGDVRDKVRYPPCFLRQAQAALVKLIF